VEAHYRPTLILTSEHDHIKGSGRSIPEFDLYLALCACQDLLISFGGHRQAAGLSLAPENLPALRERFAKAAADQLGLSRPLPSLCLEGELSFADIHQPFLKELELLGPYGCGNPEPVFASGPLSVRSRRAFGTNHVSLDVRDNQAGVTLRAKAWRMADKLGPQTSGQTLRLAFTPRLDTYNGLASIELSVRDFRAGDA
jgi:single-stranded-DNA-specific exonuclease